MMPVFIFASSLLFFVHGCSQGQDAVTKEPVTREAAAANDSTDTLGYYEVFDYSTDNGIINDNTIGRAGKGDAMPVIGQYDIIYHKPILKHAVKTADSLKGSAKLLVRILIVYYCITGKV